jgi:hypothetical protein
VLDFDMLNKDVTHPKIAETDRETPHSARKNKVGFGNLYIDAEKIAAYDPVLASVVIVTEKRSC